MINNISPYSTKFRVSGIATGMDTDQMVKDLMRVERIPLDRLMQKKQLAEWRRDDYRKITSLLRGLKDNYLDITKPSNCLSLQSTFSKFTAASSDNTVVTAVGGAGAVAGNHTITVTKLATVARTSSSAGVSDPLLSEAVITTGVTSDVVNASGKKINVTIDGVTKEITMGTYTDTTTVTDVASDLQAKISAAFGAGKVTVSNNAGQLNFVTGNGASKITLGSGSTSDGLVYLHFTPGASNRLDTSKTLADLASKFATNLTFTNDQLKFTINSKEFTFSKTTTLSSMLNTINTDSTANVSISYDEITDKFNITSKQLGAGENITISQTDGNFFGGVGVGAAKIDVGSYSGGQDADVTIDGQNIKRSSNTFTINGVTYTLLKEGASATVSMKTDVDGVFNTVKGFIEKYNEIIDTLNTKLSEKYEREYQPLTAEQKEAMKEEDIKKWEEKAKTGLLHGDSLLRDLLYNLRNSMIEKVSGSGLTLGDLGLDTVSRYNKGKFEINEAKLKAAIEKNPDQIINIFTKKSETYPLYTRDLTAEQRKIRRDEEGLAQRLYDIIEDNISTISNSNGQFGKLLEKAGMVGERSETSNMLYMEIKDYNSRISEMNDLLITKENNYYKKFAAMEKAIMQMNNQSSWFMSQMGK